MTTFAIGAIGVSKDELAGMVDKSATLPPRCEKNPGQYSERCCVGVPNQLSSSVLKEEAHHLATGIGATWLGVRSGRATA
jgi:hypothetical protein